MTVTLRRTPFNEAERALVIEAVMTGQTPEGFSELAPIALTIAEQLPELLAKARLPDNSDNRRKVVNLVLVRWSQPKGPRPSRSYRRFAR